MKIKIVREKISKNELEELAKDFYGFMIKGAIDIDREIVAFGGEYHIDANSVLIQEGSRQENIWGFNIYPDHTLDFISLINIRPSEGNRSMEIKDDKLQAVISAIVKKFLPCPVGNDEKI